MESINYTIIIPHFGDPGLLSRAMASVPSRDDVELLVEEDTGRKGAGYARNRALDRARGKWILFLDSDDFFEPVALSLLDRHADDEAEVICFNIRAVHSDTLLPSERQSEKTRLLEKYASRPADLDFFCRYCYPEPWGKMIRRELIVREGIRFDETVCANDYMFSVLCGLNAGKVAYDPSVLYVVTERPGSVSSGYIDRPDKLQSRMDVYWRVQRLFDSRGIRLHPFYGLWMMCRMEGGEVFEMAERFRKDHSISRFRILKGCLERILRKRLRTGVPNNA